MPDSLGSGTYRADAVSFLLKPITLEPVEVSEKERLIQSGARHYSEMISVESPPDETYMAIYTEALRRNAVRLASHINTLANALASHSSGGRGLALASLARAGTPIGVLLTLALRARGIHVEHYSVSIIRGRGLDLHALRYILARHDRTDIVFVDGWTGKGAIADELRRRQGALSLGVSPYLVVVADPAGQADLAATGDDYVIPSGILNGVVSGLISRSILNEQIQGEDFHGCIVLESLRPLDVSQAFIDAIALELPTAAAPAENEWTPQLALERRRECQDLLRTLLTSFDVRDVNRIKPGIAEATRAVLRRVPERLLIRDVADPEVRHLVYLAADRHVPIEPMPCRSAYKAVAIIGSVGSD